MADEHAQVYSADERIQQEGREPSGCRVAALRALQFCARAPELARYPGDGSAGEQSALVARRVGRAHVKLGHYRG